MAMQPFRSASGRPMSSSIVQCDGAASACLCTVLSVSSAAPRLTCDVRILDGAVELQGKSASHMLLRDMVASLHELPQPVPYKGAPRIPSKIMVTLKAPLKMQRSQVLYLVLTPKPGTLADLLEKDCLDAAWFHGLDCDGDALLQLLPKALGTALEQPVSTEFSSANGHPSVACHVKTDEGSLFPMPSGLVFVQKPAIFIPCSSVTKVQFFPTPRFLELEVTYLNGNGEEVSICFSNLDRSEEGDLQDYSRRKRLGKCLKRLDKQGCEAMSSGVALNQKQVTAAAICILDEPVAATAAEQPRLPSSKQQPLQKAVAIAVAPASDESDDSDWECQEGEEGEDEESSSETSVDWECGVDDVEEDGQQHDSMESSAKGVQKIAQPPHCVDLSLDGEVQRHKRIKC